MSMVPKYCAPQVRRSPKVLSLTVMRKRLPDAGEPNNVSCWRSADGEDFVRQHKAEVLNSPDGNKVVRTAQSRSIEFPTGIRW